MWLHAKRKMDFRLAIKSLRVENGLPTQAPARGAHWILAHLTWHPCYKARWMHGPHEQLKMLRREEFQFSLFHVCIYNAPRTPAPHKINACGHTTLVELPTTNVRSDWASLNLVIHLDSMDSDVERGIIGPIV